MELHRDTESNDLRMVSQTATTPRATEERSITSTLAFVSARSPQQLVISVVRSHVCTMRIRVSDIGCSATATECDAAIAEAHPTASSPRPTASHCGDLCSRALALHYSAV